MNKKIRFVRSSLLTMLAASLVVVSAACSSGANEANNGGTNTPASPSSSPEEKRDPVTLKIEVFERGNSPSGLTVTNNHMTKYIQEEFGDPRNITVEFVPVPRAEEITKLNVLMATSDVPDLVFTYDVNTAYKFVKQGGVMELSEALDQYGADLKTFMGEDALDAGKFDDGQYSIVAKREFLGRWARFVRQDWLDALNMPAPTNKDELYTVLKAFKEQDPGKVGNKVIPYGFAMNTASFFSPMWSFIEPTTEEEQFVNTQQYGDLDNPILLEGHKEGLRWFNKLYNEGLLSPDFGLDKDGKQLTQAVMNGFVGFYAGSNSEAFAAKNKVSETLNQNVPSAELKAIDTFQAADGTYPKPLYGVGGMYIMIPKSSKRVQEAIEYLSWMSNPDVYQRISYGEEGRNYELVDGYPVVLDEELNKVELYNTGDYKLLTTGTFFGSIEKNIKSVDTPSEKYGKQLMESMELSLVDGYQFVKLPRPLESQSTYGEALKQKYDQLIVQTIMAKPENFDSVYDSAVQDYMKSGGQAVVDERKALWAEMKK
ncbi:extracellular solute-binding protein [Paenibacillus sp. strain BS8-2]